MKEATAGWMGLVIGIAVTYFVIWSAVTIIDYRVKLGTDRLIECLEQSLTPKECK